METPTSSPSPLRSRSPRPKGLTRRSSRRDNSNIDPLQALLSDPSSPGSMKKTSSKGPPLPTRRKSSRNRGLEPVEPRDSGKDARRVSFGDSVVDIGSSDNMYDDVVERGRSKDRGPGKRSLTPFIKRRLSSLDDVDDGRDASEDMISSSTSPKLTPETRTASRGSQLAQRRSSRTRDVDGASRETFDLEKEKREFSEEAMAKYFPGDSSDEEVYERGRGREREQGPAKRSSTPFVRRRFSSRDDVDDDDYAAEDMSSPSTSPRLAQETTIASLGSRLPRRKGSHIGAVEGASRESSGRGHMPTTTEDTVSQSISPRRAVLTTVGSRDSQVVQRKTSKTRDVEGASSESCDREKTRRVNFAENLVVDYLAGDSSDEEIHERGRGRGRGPGKRSSTPFFRRRSSSREDDDDTDDASSSSSASPRSATKASSGSQPVRRKSRKYESGENVSARRVNFVARGVDYVPGDSSDEDIVERGRGRERGPGRQSSTPLTKTSCSLSDDDGTTLCERCRMALILSYCNIGSVDIEPRI